jgi:anti-sigma-K factor RskA
MLMQFWREWIVLAVVAVLVWLVHQLLNDRRRDNT